MFWKRTESQAALKAVVPAVSQRPKIVDPHREMDQALHTVGAILHSFGEFAFDTERWTAEALKAECEQMLSIFLNGPSKQQAEVTDESTKEPGLERRDWGTVHRFFDAHRRHEQSYVETSLGNLRHAVQCFAQCLTVTVTEDRRDEQQIQERLERLVGVLEGHDTAAIRHEAGEVVRVVRHTLQTRRGREKEQLLILGKRVQDLRDELDRAREKATLDGLTHLYNRAAFDAELEKVAALGLLLGSEPTLLMVDVDHFKSINDRFGHPSGDVVLRHVADTLVRHFVRKVDFVARYGGEEFVVVARDSTLDKVAQRAERVRQVIEQTPVVTPSGEVELTVSLGVTALVPGEAPESWVQRADRALYAAKNGGRNCLKILHGDSEPPA